MRVFPQQCLLTLAATVALAGAAQSARAQRAPNVNNIRLQVAFTDEEWPVIEPHLQQIVTDLDLLRATTRNNSNGNLPLQVAQRELAEELSQSPQVLSNIAAKLRRVQEERAALRKELAQAQEQLRVLLTLRQEALLVNMGYLE
jgi:chromosome segregation ATPase